MESSVPGSSSAPVGHASMQSVHEPQPASSGPDGSTAWSLTSVPRTTQDPCRRVIASVFLP